MGGGANCEVSKGWPTEGVTVQHHHAHCGMRFTPHSFPAESECPTYKAQWVIIIIVHGMASFVHGMAALVWHQERSK